MEGYLFLLVPPLLVVLLVIERRREKARRELLARAEAGELTEADLAELEAEQEALREAEQGELPWRESLRRFLRGAPTRRLTALDFWEGWHGLIGIVLIGFLLYKVGEDAVKDPVARKVVLVAAGVIAALAGLGWLLRRQKAQAAARAANPAAPIEPE
ncbi:MAG TPA: hypothetical protein VGQ78_00775 [Vicinamibacteria bacterium]|nr:hypothetical protein [Vicinamibacteria bacterium]